MVLDYLLTILQRYEKLLNYANIFATFFVKKYTLFRYVSPGLSEGIGGLARYIPEPLSEGMGRGLWFFQRHGSIPLWEC